MDPINEALKIWLEQKLGEWRSANPRANVKDFAEYLDIEPGTFNHYLNGIRLPVTGNVIKLANKLGDEIFDILQIERPERPRLVIRELEAIYDSLSDDKEKEQFLENARNFRGKRKK